MAHELAGDVVGSWDGPSLVGGREGGDGRCTAGARTFREGHAYYDWNTNRTTLQMNVIGEAGAGTHERCNELRRGFLSALMFGIPTLLDGSAKSLSAAQKKYLTEKIDGWFSHYGYRKQDRDEQLGGKMARIVLVEGRGTRRVCEEDVRVPRSHL